MVVHHVIGAAGIKKHDLEDATGMGLCPKTQLAMLKWLAGWTGLRTAFCIRSK